MSVLISQGRVVAQGKCAGQVVSQPVSSVQEAYDLRDSWQSLWAFQVDMSPWKIENFKHFSGAPAMRDRLVELGFNLLPEEIHGWNQWIEDHNEDLPG